jgi:DNA-binding transcriptional ArsR family regulator
MSQHDGRDPLGATFAALADPIRREILFQVSVGKTSVSELAAPFDISPPAISRHLKVLERAGLIERGREAQWRPCRLRTEALHEAANYFNIFRRHWESRLDALDGYLAKKHRKIKR